MVFSCVSPPKCVAPGAAQLGVPPDFFRIRFRFVRLGGYDEVPPNFDTKNSRFFEEQNRCV